MILECCQILYTSLSFWGIVVEKGMKPVHQKHPCVLWAAGCQRHFYWVCQLGLELHERYHTIYQKTHKCLNHLKRLMEIDLCKIPVTITLNEWYKLPFVKPRVDTIFKKRICTEEPPQGCEFGVACMDLHLITPSLVQSYHNWYVEKQKNGMNMKWHKHQGVYSFVKTRCNM